MAKTFKQLTDPAEICEFLQVCYYIGDRMEIRNFFQITDAALMDGLNKCGVETTQYSKDIASLIEYKFGVPERPFMLDEFMAWRKKLISELNLEDPKARIPEEELPTGTAYLLLIECSQFKNQAEFKKYWRIDNKVFNQAIEKWLPKLRAYPGCKSLPNRVADIYPSFKPIDEKRGEKADKDLVFEKIFL